MEDNSPTGFASTDNGALALSDSADPTKIPLTKTTTTSVSTKDCPEPISLSFGKSPSPSKFETKQDLLDKNPYAYLDRDEFTSEKFKIEVSGLPKHYGFGELRKLFNNKLKVNAHKMIPPRKGCNFMFVNFKSEEDRQSAIQKIDGYSWKNKILSAKPAKAAEDPLVKKRLNEEIDGGESGFLSTETVQETVRRVTTPWWNIPYDEQLNRKMSMVKDIFSEMRKGIFGVQNNLQNTGVLNEDVIQNIQKSPVIEKYRNKCEFSIGYNPESKEKTVGFRLSSYKQGSTAVGPIDSVTHVPHVMVKVVLKFQDFVRASKYDVYHPETHQGCFRQLTVRTTGSDTVMMIVALSRKEINDESFEVLKHDMKKEFSDNSNDVKSFYIKFLTEYGHPDKTPPELLFGSETITENLLGLQFEISPEAFFQVNIAATEVLYKCIGDLLEENNATLLDVCSGTGTIGLSVSNKCCQVLGIEMIASAVSDARRNAEINGLSEKCDFFTGKAEDIIEPVLVRAKSDNIVAVVDPPRAGLHQKVLYSLRKCEKIRTLIYVACNAKAAMKNFIDLSRPTSNAFKGKPFIPVKLIPVDMFPNSPHFELIIVFARLSSILNVSVNQTGEKSE